MRILKEEKLHSGYLKLAKYDFEIPSFKTEMSVIKLTQREVVQSADAVHVLLYSPTQDGFLLCKEFRPGPFLNKQADNPFLLTVVSGTIEQHETPEQTAHKEISEETGLEVEHLQTITAVYKSPGITTEKSYIFYAEIMSSNIGIYGIGEEEIQTQFLSRTVLYDMMDEGLINDSSTWIALAWFRMKKNAM